MTHLEQDFHCTALDLPGFGASAPLDSPSIVGMAQWVLRQLALLDIYDCVLIGHSMGAKIAVQLAALPHELEIHRLVLVAPSPPSQEPMPPEEKERMLHHPDRSEAERTVRSAAVADLSSERWQFAVESQLSIDHPTWRWWLLEGMTHSIAEAASTLSIPVTVLSSEDDPVIPPATIQKEVLSVLPDTQHLSTRRAGHLLPLEHPEWVAAQIREVVERRA